MEYPGTHFTRPWRIAFLGFFIVAFLIISPILILYTSGYRYDFKNGIIQETGAISIDILPKNAITYLNDSKLNAKIPIRLKNLAQGKYKVRLTADGYYDWEKEVVVENKQTVYIKEIKLIKKSEPQKISSNKVNKLYLSTDHDFIVYQTNETPTAFWLKNLKNDEERQILKGVAEKNYEVKWSKSKNNLVMITSDDLSDVYIFNANNIDKILNVTKTEKNKITRVQWNESSQSEFFYSTKNQIMLMNVDTQQKLLVGKNTFNDWYVENGQVWSLQNSSTTDQLIIIKDTFGFSKEISQSGNLVNNNTSDWKFAHAQNNQILLKKNGISDMLLLDQNKQFTFFGDKMLVSDFNNWWIAWTPWEITTYSQDEDPFLLNRSGEQLQKIIVMDEYNTLGLIWADKMTALFPYYFVSHNLLNTKINDAEADTQRRELYFSANLNNQDGLWKIQY